MKQVLLQVCSHLTLRRQVGTEAKHLTAKRGSEMRSLSVLHSYSSNRTGETTAAEESVV